MSGRPKAFTKEQELEIVAWWKAQVGVTEKAKELGVSQTTIYRVLADYGFPVGTSSQKRKYMELKRHERRNEDERVAREPEAFGHQRGVGQSPA